MIFTLITVTSKSGDTVTAQTNAEKTISSKTAEKTTPAIKTSKNTNSTVAIATNSSSMVADSAEFTENISANEYDVELLARLIYVEGGCKWFPKWVKEYIGSVVLNRVASSLYPDTIEEVIYDPYQYEPDQLYLQEPDEEAFEIARWLLENGSVLPPDVLGQNGDNTGDDTYDTYYDETLDSTIYFTYVYG